MAVKQLDKSEWTKDGRKWIFYDYVKNLDGTRRKYKSKRFFTKTEALKAEREFLTTNTERADENNYLSVNKNVVATRGDEDKPYMVTTPKTKSSVRNIPVPKVLLDDLKTLYGVSSKHYGFNNSWYVFGDTEPITNGKIRTRKNKNCELAGVKQIRIHDFRHSCASLLINSGATINVVAKYLGHTKIDETLNTYSHLFKNQMNEIINIIDNLN